MKIQEEIEKTLATEQKDIFILQMEMDLMTLIRREFSEWFMNYDIRNETINRQRHENT